MRQAQGFTLFELVLVMVLLGITLVGASRVVRAFSDIYLQQSNQDQLVSQSRFVLERLTRELRDVTPNSVRLNTAAGVQCLEFVPFSVSGRYRAITLSPDSRSFLDVISLDSNFSVQANQYLVVYPTQVSDIYSSSAQRVQLAATPLGNDADGESATYRLQLASASSFGRGSPAQRYYLLQNPVSYCVQAGQLWRYQGYSLQSTQPMPGSGLSGGSVMATGVVNNVSSQPVFAIAAASLQRNAMINIWLRFASSNDSATVLSFHHIVQVQNVP